MRRRISLGYAWFDFPIQNVRNVVFSIKEHRACHSFTLQILELVFLLLVQIDRFLSSQIIVGLLLFHNGNFVQPSDFTLLLHVRIECRESVTAKSSSVAPFWAFSSSMRSLSSWICRLNSSVLCFSFSNACSRSHTCSRFKALDNKNNSYFRVGRVPLLLWQKFECHNPKVCPTNIPILKSSSYLQQLQHVVHGVKPINRRRTRQTIQCIQIL